MLIARNGTGTPASSSGSMTGSAGKCGKSTLWEISQGVFWFSVIFLLHTLSRTEGEKNMDEQGNTSDINGRRCWL